MNNKFVENAISKLEQGYNLNWLDSQFDFSCTMCCTRNLLKCSCSVCPIAEKYKQIRKEILSGERSRNGKYLKYSDKQGHKTLFISFENVKAKNISITVK